MLNSKKEYIENIKILFVEDDIEILNNLEEVLKLHYPNIETASNGKIGYDRYLEFLPDIVITDIQMPIMNGLEMSELIKKHNQNAKIIIISAFNEIDYLKKAINLGISNYVTKPLNHTLLFDSLDKISTDIYNATQIRYANHKVIQEKKRAQELEHIANESNKAKSMFLANMSHEIRTPLNAIQGFIDVLIEDEIDTRKLSYLDIVHKNSKSLLQIINDILDFSKIESGKLDISMEKYNLYEQIDNVASLFCAKAKEKELILSIFIEPNISRFFNSDDLRIRQIISNLLSNAIKFTEKNGVVSLNITSDVKNQTIKFCVKDTGRGISEEYLKTIFDSFSQEDNSITKTFGGTGLGLAISFKLVDMLGGELKVKSELGKGSEFYFELPTKDLKEIEQVFTKEKLLPLVKSSIAIIYPNAAKNKILPVKLYLESFKIKTIKEYNQIEKDSLEDFDFIIICGDMIDKDTQLYLKQTNKVIIVLKSKINTTMNFKDDFIELDCPISPIRLFNNLINDTTDIELKQTDSELLKINFKGKKILLVEDNKSNQQFMSIILKKLEFSFDIASDGLEAIDKFNTSTYDAILMDENMPNMSGLESTKRILEIEQKKNLEHTPIVALTANALIGDRKRFLDIGMDEYLTKPLDKKKLIKILHNILN